jgi:hypothetical protein
VGSICIGRLSTLSNDVLRMSKEIQELVFDIQEQINYNNNVIDEFINLSPRCDYGVYRDMKYRAEKAKELNNLFERSIELLKGRAAEQ